MSNKYPHPGDLKKKMFLQKSQNIFSALLIKKMLALWLCLEGLFIWLIFKLACACPC